MRKIIILDNVVGGEGEDNDMTAPFDMTYTLNKLMKLAFEKKLEKPYSFIILPKKWYIKEYPYQMWKMSKMFLIDKNDKVIETQELIWK